jgi:hypothetical protein
VFDADDDVVLLDEEMLIQEAIWRYRRSTGQNYAEDFRQAQITTLNRIAADGGRKKLDLATRSPLGPGVLIPRVPGTSRMLLDALEKPLSRGREASLKVVPFPVQGWNTRDRYDENWKYAPILTNIRPVAGKGELRQGFTAHATGLPSEDVETLMVYRAGTTEECYACVDGKIYDVTSSGAVGAADVSSLTNNRWQWVMHSNGTSLYLVAVNGADGVRTYEGSTWASQSITNVTPGDLIHVTSHQQRLWFIEDGTLSLWYLATYAIAGAATELDLGGIFKKGGELTAIDTWSYDGGNGPDDYLVAISSQGEVAIYAGTDPSASSTWALSGVFQIDKPLGRKCTTKFGADLAILTESGVVLLSQVLNTPAGRDLFSSPIRDQFVNAAIEAGSSFGWQVLMHPKRNELVVNVPTNTTDALQFIHAGLNKAWWKQEDHDAICWAECGGSLYFGTTSGGHYKADTGTDDNGAAITGDVQPSWSRFGTPLLKQFTMLRPHLVTDGSLSVLGSVKVDWDESDLDAPVTTLSTSGGVQWDAAQWDVPQWAGALSISGPWATAEGEGIVGAPRLRFSTKTSNIQINAIDVMFIVGGLI